MATLTRAESGKPKAESGKPKAESRERRARRATRRGVLLLVVLGLLAMFALLALSFVMITTQGRRGADAFARVDQYADPAEELLNQAAGQVLRGSGNLGSALHGEGLLEDIYSAGTIYGTLTGAVAAVGGQFYNLTGNVYWDEAKTNQLNAQQVATEMTRRIGSVLTVTSPASPAAMTSYRIVGLDIQAGTLQVLVEGTPPTGSEDFVINGPAFSGTGRGYSPQTGLMNLPYSDAGGAPTWPVALLPRPFVSEADFQAWLLGPDGVQSSGDEPSAALQTAITSMLTNEDYDAADYQNMLLGLVLPGGITPIPSLHRPELVQFWSNRPDWSDAALGPQLPRKIILRPLGAIPNPPAGYVPDHPNFTGSNPNFNPAWDGVTAGAGQWDVDNDGDGIPDSIWVDPGLPARAAKDGRMYRPLFAILCLDMDGRLNLNAHSSHAQLATEYNDPASGPYAGTTPGNFQVALPRGEGYGPAEVRLLAMLPANEVAQLLRGNAGAGIEGRYGELLTAPSPPGPQAGVTNAVDGLSRVKFFQFPDDYTDVLTGALIDPAKLTSFGNPPDLWGRGTVGLDYAGQPLYWRPTTFDGAAQSWWAAEVSNGPYKINLSRRRPRSGGALSQTPDNPFTAGEFERLLRGYDLDAAKLPGRLLALAPSLAGRRTEVTTESADVPVPPGSLRVTPDIGGNGRVGGLVELLRQRLILGHGFTLPLNAAQQTTIANDIARMLSWDVLSNRRLDVNRPLGNGRDSSTPNNAVVDEATESTLEAGWQGIFPGLPGPFVFWLTNGLDANNDGAVNAGDQPMARHLLARHLYVLGMLLSDAGYDLANNPFLFPTPGESGLLPPQQRELTTRRIAQWAVNVVDFRDADAIMTPFEYDANPFDGWDVDGVLGSADDTHAQRRLVWGCEAPELLLTEAGAWHDRRVADTTYDSTGKRRTDDDGSGNPADLDLDQPLIPRGSTYFELYCPRNPTNPVAPGELYVYSGGQWSLDVTRLAPADGGGQQYPVWRMVVGASRIGAASNDVLDRVRNNPHSSAIEPRQQQANPQISGDFSLLHGANVPEVDIDRIIWLAPLPPAGHRDAERVYYNRVDPANPTLIPCGGYGLVGPRRINPIGGTTTLGQPSPHEVRLAPAGLIDNDGANNYPSTATTIKPPVGILVAHDPPAAWGANSAAADLGAGLPAGLRYGIGISISEPIPGVDTYYPEPLNANPENGGMVEAYVNLADGSNPQPALDSPLDNSGPLGQESLLRTQTTRQYKSVFLQRLADPTRPYQPSPTQPNYNPYLTVDWSPVDLTVFNGSDRQPPWPPGWLSQPQNWDPDDSNPDATQDMRFCTRQRGPAQYAAGNMAANLWSWMTSDPPDTNNQNIATLNFRHSLGKSTDPIILNRGQTLGFVNQGYGVPWAPAVPPFPMLVQQVYRGVPADPGTGNPLPFPWLTWNNRPFASPLEVLLVPTSHPARLGWEFSLAFALDPYRPLSPVPPDPPRGGNYAQTVPFDHLLNFFHTLDTSDPSPPGPPTPNFYRLLDFLEVPSRFVGTELVVNPQNAGQNVPDTVLHRPPFNMVSDYREPGKVNINTIASADVWNALLNGHPGPAWNQFVESRRGYAGANIAAMDPRYPTRFANPFRSAACADLVPRVDDPPRLDILKRTRPVNVSLLRATGPDPDASSVPLLADPSQLPGEYRDPNRNPYFAYQRLSRVSNLVTTRSNVYAVWITVGYFEVSPANPVPPLPPAQYRALYPDGYWLGRELGSDTGEIRRHRAFYLIDRSIPVGFVRGQDLNSASTILLKRFIE